MRVLPSGEYTVLGAGAAALAVAFPNGEVLALTFVAEFLLTILPSSLALAQSQMCRKPSSEKTVTCLPSGDRVAPVTRADEPASASTRCVSLPEGSSQT